MNKNPNLMEKHAHEILKSFEPVVDCVADLLGPACEVVLHDVRDPGHSVIKIRNGHVTGRRVGSPLTNLGMDILSKPGFRRSTLGNYRSETEDGRTLNCNAVMIRGEKSQIIGMLCINWDITPLLSFQHLFMGVHTGPPDRRRAQRYTEHHAKNVPSLIGDMIEDTIRRSGRRNGEMKKEQRLRVVRVLYHKGIFKARGAVGMVARSLGVSNVCIYKYIEEVQR